jgi:uncharacterized protein YcfJ
MDLLHKEIHMQASTPSATPRLHPLVVTAAASVTVVSLVGAAAILGLFPSSNSTALPAAPAAFVPATVPAPAQLVTSLPAQATPTRFETADGRVFEEVGPAGARAAAVDPEPAPAPVVRKPVKAVQHKVVHHAAPSVAPEPREAQVQTPAPSYAEQHPVRSYVSDMSPVGTGLGAVVGGVLGHQVGGGNGKKLATVAGALIGGYAGNEVAHDRNPLPFTDGK